MNLDNYIKDALRSETPVTELTGDPVFVRHALRVLIAAGALADLLKKELVYGKTIPARLYRATLNSVAEAAGSADYSSGDVGVSPRRQTLPLQARLMHAALGGFGEQAELLEQLDGAFSNKPTDWVNVIEEVGDTMWYLAVALDEIRKVRGLQPGTVSEANIFKLMTRFPEKFSLAASEGRDVAAERAVLEKAT